MKIIITEQQNEQLNRKIRLAVEKLGLIQSREIFGDNIIKEAYTDNSESFLNPFKNLRLDVEGDDCHYIDEDGKKVIYYDKTFKKKGVGSVFFDCNTIFNFFTEVMDFDWPEIDPILLNFLEKEYNHTGQGVSCLDMTEW
jgi:hypothetical protein